MVESSPGCSPRAVIKNPRPLLRARCVQSPTSRHCALTISGGFSRSLSDLEVVGCKSAAAVHFPPSFCPIAGLWGCKSGKNCPRWGRFSLSTLQVRQTPRTGWAVRPGCPYPRPRSARSCDHERTIRCGRTVSADRSQKPEQQPENQRFLPPERAWMAKLLHTTGPRGGWSTFIACCVQKPRATPILDGAAAVRPDPTTWGGGWTAS